MAKDSAPLTDAEHAATFPPGTPHSVINAFKEPVDTKPADPREAVKEEKKGKKDDA